MWDVVRFAEQIHYKAIVVENVVEATAWVLWPAWWAAMASLGYTGTVLSRNSMHHGVPQSRDRIFVVWTRDGLKPDLEAEHTAWCGHCSTINPCRQRFKQGRTVGRYHRQWVWSCTTCHRIVDPIAPAAATIIDWQLDCPRIGTRTRPLATATRARILAGLQRYGWAPITTTGAGNVHERTPGNRARPVTDPLPTQQTTLTAALAVPPEAFALNTAHGGRLHDLTEPHPTVCASDDRLSLVVPMRNHGHATTTDEPVNTVSAGGNHHGLIMTGYSNGSSGDPARRVRPTSAPMPSQTTTATPALLMRNNGGGAEMSTPVNEPARTMTTAGHQSLLLPYYGNGQAQPVDRPMPTQPSRDRFALVDTDQVIDDCGFRMLEPYEVAAAMAFPVRYIPLDLPKKDQVKLAGNAVTPPVMEWIVGRIIQALEAAA